jgi:endonuclease-3
MEDLLTLPGVARKTANVVLGTWYGKNDGVVVDTHVQRLTRRMGLTRQYDPKKIEKDLMKVIPRDEWTNISHRLILHGRSVCQARVPRCDDCVIGADLCLSYEPDLARWRSKKTVKKKAAKKKTAKKKKAKARTKVTRRPAAKRS